MAEWNFSTSCGDLTQRGWCAETMQRASEIGEQLARAGRVHNEWTEFHGQAVRLKAGPTKDRWAGSVYRRVLGRKAPAIQEYVNLCWLIERHFQTVLPLAAGVFTTKGTPSYQFLLTRRNADTMPVSAAMHAATEGERAVLREELARELGRMHALGFRHGNLHPDGLRVRSHVPLGHRRVVFQSPWGKRPGRVVTDLAQLLAGDFVDQDATDSFLAAYTHQRAVQGRPLKLASLGARVAREGSRLGRDSSRQDASPWCD